jgi:hypothetical protein
MDGAFGWGARASWIGFRRPGDRLRCVKPVAGVTRGSRISGALGGAARRDALALAVRPLRGAFLVA